MSRNTQQARHREGWAAGHLSPRSQLTRRSAPCLHSTPRTDSCLNTHTRMYVKYGEEWHPLIHTNTPKQLHSGQSPGPAGTDGVSWELTACPAAPWFTHIHSQMRPETPHDLKKEIYTSPEKCKALWRLFIKATHVQVFLSRDGFVRELTPMCPTSKQLQPAHEKKSFRECVVYEAGQQPEAVCLCSRDMRLKVLAQELHWYFFTSEWVCRWARRLERSAKARLQCWQAKGRSPGEKKNKTVRKTLHSGPNSLS